MTKEQEARAAIESARREWIAAFDDNIQAMSTSRHNSQLTATVVFFGGVPRHVVSGCVTRKDLAAPHK